MTEFNRFVDIAHRPLQVYNRAVMFFNLYEDQGKHVAEEYANSFTKEERLQMAQITALTKRVGTKRVKELVTHGMVFTDDDYKEESLNG